MPDDSRTTDLQNEPQGERAPSFANVSDELTRVLHLLGATEMAVQDLPEEYAIMPLYTLVSVTKDKLRAAMDELDAILEAEEDERSRRRP
jgi:hypothetical protein